MHAEAVQDIDRYVQVDDRLAIAGQPSQAQLAALAGAGFEVIINLGLHDDARYALSDEAGTVAKLGLSYVHIPVRFDAPAGPDLLAFFAAMERAAGRKVFVHCAHNKRVPVFLALYRVIRQGWREDAALAAMREVWQPDATWQAFITRSLAKD